MPQVRLIIGVIAVLGAGLLAGGNSAAAAGPRTLLVDDDRAQCPAARFNSVQPAVKAALRGDRVLVCGGTYTETVLIRRPLSLTAQTPAATAVNCLANDTARDPRIAVIIGAVTAAADDVTIDGLVITATDQLPVRTGITTDDKHSGYIIRRNVLQDLGNFGIEVQASGRRQTTVESNCVRRNGGAPGENVGDRAELSLKTVLSAGR